jgi:hypothetical protein
VTSFSPQDTLLHHWCLMCWLVWLLAIASLSVACVYCLLLIALTQTTHACTMGTHLVHRPAPASPIDQADSGVCSGVWHAVTVVSDTIGRLWRLVELYAKSAMGSCQSCMWWL